jgi:hypothetical protein
MHGAAPAMVGTGTGRELDIFILPYQIAGLAGISNRLITKTNQGNTRMAIVSSQSRKLITKTNQGNNADPY